MSRFLAIDVDAGGLFVAAGTVRGGAAKVEQAVALTDDVPALTAETARPLGERLKELLKAAGIAPAPALVGVGRDRVILKDLKFPPVPPADEPNIVRFQALKEVTDAPEDVVLDYAPAAGGGPDGERRATAVVVRRAYFQACQALCAAAGLKLAAVTPRPFAAAATLRAGVPDLAPGAAVGLLTVGPAGGEFTAVRGGEVLFSRPVPAPAVANDTALIGELKRNLIVYGGQNPASPLDAVYVPDAEGAAGPVARVRAGAAVAVRAFDPLGAAVPTVPPAARGRFAGAVGLLAARAAADAMPINFAQPRQPKATADPRRARVLLGVLAACLLLAVGGVVVMLEMDRGQREINRLLAEKADLESEKARLEAEAKRVKIVEEWEARQVNWLDELYDLTDRFPDFDQSRVTSLSGALIAPDKAGKQVAHGRLEVKLGTKNPDAVSALLTAINRDNTDKRKYYVGAQKTSGGLAGGGTPFNQLFTVTTLVNHRTAGEFVRLSPVSPPKPGATATAPAARPAGKAAVSGWFDD